MVENSARNIFDGDGRMIFLVQFLQFIPQCSVGVLDGIVVFLLTDYFSGFDTRNDGGTIIRLANHEEGCTFIMRNFLIGFAYLLPCLWFYVSLVLFFQILTRHRSSAIAITYVAMAIFTPVLLIIIGKFGLNPSLIILSPSKITQSIAGMMGSYDLAFLQAHNYTDKILSVYNMLYIMLGWIALVWAGIYFVGRKREF